MKPGRFYVLSNPTSVTFWDSGISKRKPSGQLKVNIQTKLVQNHFRKKPDKQKDSLKGSLKEHRFVLITKTQLCLYQPTSHALLHAPPLISNQQLAKKAHVVVTGGTQNCYAIASTKVFDITKNARDDKSRYVFDFNLKVLDLER